jgi:hypothetical protein
VKEVPTEAPLQELTGQMICLMGFKEKHPVPSVHTVQGVRATHEYLSKHPDYVLCPVCELWHNIHSKERGPNDRMALK